MQIKEIQEKLKISSYTLRYYEKMGLIQPYRDENGYRNYNEEDIHKIERIMFLRDINVPIEDIKDILDNKVTFQDVLENHIEKVNTEIKSLQYIKNMCKDENIVIHASGRTDAKVHGRRQVFHFDTLREMPEKQWKRAINHFLPNDIYIIDSFLVDENFHSRYSATKKEYHYMLSMNDYSPFETNYIYQYGKELDIEAMRNAAKIFIGEHDFASFCAVDQYGNTIRTLYQIEIENNQGIVTFKLVGNGFRRYMVRHLVGGLIQVGAHRITKEFLEELIESKGQKKCLFKAKPQGLYLHEVFYK